MTQHVYTPDDYDDNDCLRPPGALVLVLIYLMKYIMLVVIPQLPIVGRNMDWVSKAIPTDIGLLLCAIPALLVTIAWVKRNPKAKPKAWQRKTWLDGRRLLLSSAIIPLLLWLAYLLFGMVSVTEPLLMMLYLDAMLVLYLWRSHRLRDAFLDYPEAHAPKTADKLKDATSK